MAEIVTTHRCWWHFCSCTGWRGMSDWG